MSAPGGLRILHLASSERWTGVADPVASVALRQQSLGCNVWLGCGLSRSFEQQARDRGLRVLEFLHLDSGPRPIHWAADVRNLARFIAERRIQVIHCHLEHDHWLAAFARRAIQSPVVLARTVHRSGPPRRNPLHRWLFRQATDLVIALSGESRSEIAEALRLAPEDIPVIRGAVNIEHFHPVRDGSAFRRDLGVSPDETLAGNVARMVEGRGHRWILEGLARATDAAPGLRLALIGRGPLKKILQREILALPARERVIMAGYRREDLPDAYAGLDFHIIAGPGSEGSCRAALEAMATGRANIAARVGALAEMIRDGVDGLLVEKGDTQGLAEAMSRLALNRDEARAMGRRAREAVTQRFREETRAIACLTAYHEAWKRKYGRPPNASLSSDQPR